MYPNIKNFITVRWTKRVMEPPPPWRSDLKTRDLDEYNQIQIRLLDRLAWQLRVLYPEALLHVITNEDHANRDNMVFHKFEFPPSHRGKFFMYGLLREPAMYLDADILIVKKFTRYHLDVVGPYNFYGSTSWHEIDKYTVKPLPVDIEMQNSGIVWIPRPSKELTDLFFRLQEEYFEGAIIETDEGPPSLHARMNNIPMKVDRSVNVPKGAVPREKILDQQSIHYTGYDLDIKRGFFGDLKQYGLASKSLKQWL